MVDLDKRAQKKAQRIARLVKALDYNRSALNHVDIEATYDTIIETLEQQLEADGIDPNKAAPPQREERETEQLVQELHMSLKRAAEEFPRTWFQAILEKAETWLLTRGVEV